APFLGAVPEIDEDQDPGREAYGAKGGEHGGQTPDAEPVDQGETHPDEVKRDRLPRFPADHGNEVRRGEEAPAELDGVTPRPGDNRHDEPFRSELPGRASCEDGARRPRRHSSPD